MIQAILDFMYPQIVDINDQFECGLKRISIQFLMKMAI
jgi:hypothetical protein